MLHITEKILLHRIKNGDEQAFALFYDKYQPKIYRFIYFKVSDREKAQDLTGDTFIRIFDYLRAGQKIGNFQAFLYKTARNLVIDFYRTREKDAISLEDAPEIISETDVLGEVAAGLDFQNIAQAVKKLPDNYQEIITLRFINELNFGEISKITGKSPENCRILAYRGLNKLKEMLSLSKPPHE